MYQVFSDHRPPKRSVPPLTASQVPGATSSATLSDVAGVSFAAEMPATGRPPTGPRVDSPSGRQIRVTAAPAPGLEIVPAVSFTSLVVVAAIAVAAPMALPGPAWRSTSND